MFNTIEQRMFKIGPFSINKDWPKSSAVSLKVSNFEYKRQQELVNVEKRKIKRYKYFSIKLSSLECISHKNSYEHEGVKKNLYTMRIEIWQDSIKSVLVFFWRVYSFRQQ